MALVVAALLSGCGTPPVDPASSACGTCHQTIAAEWATSPHARGFTSPVFAALLPRVEASWGKAARTRCETCHAPGHGGEKHVGCISCHAAIGNRGEADGALVIDLDAPLAGPTGPRTSAHGTTTRAFLRTAGLCGTCHQVTAPELFVEETLTEFRDSGLPDAACAACHLAQGPDGGDTHRFPGLEVLLPGDAEAARALMAQALTLEAHAVDGGVEVSLRNTGAGHAVPTGVSFLRDVWVDVEFSRGDGSSLGVRRVIELGAQSLHGGLPVPLPTQADTIEKHGLAPGEGRTRVVESPTAGSTARVTLRLRAWRSDVLQALDLTDLDARTPTLDVVQITLP